MFQLLVYAKKYRKQIILGPFFKFLEAVFELILPLLMAQLVDQGIRQNNHHVVWQMTGWMICMSIIGLLCAIICQYYASIASQNFGTELRNQVMKKINSFSHAELNLFGTDTLITRMTSDINQLQLALAMLIRLVVRAPFLSIGAVIMAFTIDWQAGIVFLITLPLFCLILFFIIKTTVPLYQKVQQKLDIINELVSQNLSGVRVIRAFSRRKTEINHFAKRTDDLSTIYERVTNISALLTPATTFIMNIGILALFYLGGFKVNTGHLAQGQILALVNYMNQMLLALIVVSNLVIIFTRAAASANRVNEVLQTTPSIPNTTERVRVNTEKLSLIKTAKHQGAIAFQNVDFRFAPQFGLVLKDINFTVAPGSTLGIIGPTGSGKSTLSQLIPRFYDVTCGSVSVDNLDVRNWPLTKLRAEIAMVPQTAVLFSGTIKENLQWGKKDATDAQCWAALELAQAKDFVAALPKGLETPIFEGGKNFSGGQKQRLTIARAVISNPRILILDDSLSALDYKTDLELRQALQRELNGTLIIISQRVRSIQEAQQILVLDAGKQVGLGTHEQLLATSPQYQAIVHSQEEVSL
ncbi:multidrug ABC transporter ATP-binding protein [Enterococcus saigonensis]|uniref:Multidrug ABC transporter ATP-binding protein n=1 Tax=Enterococcus saigonensis TaxID=1805431 RepID=A0A679IGJ1_9ENTE|nr:ABC transporter ATP-binding protein [Enterococcus saigonensis]BCA84992.1 multidrug ABC transporter ATP-binding protein [Enterococcus saigonensis]